jgi:hypothetical protein
MKPLFEPTPEQRNSWNAWVAERPEPIRVVAENFNPWTLYRLKTSDHKVKVYSFYQAEDGIVKLTVLVLGLYNAVVFERKVFGILPEELEPCDLPEPGEPVGAVFTTEEEIAAYIALMKSGDI